MIDSVISDIRYSLRGLLKRPTFAIVTIVILALGIGANTAIFTLLNAVVLKPLPVRNPEELVLFSDNSGEGTSVTDGELAAIQWERFSYEQYKYFREHSRSFQEFAAFRSGEGRVAVRKADTQGEAERATAHLVSGNYFALLGRNALHGQVFTDRDDSPSAPPVAVISNGYWKQSMNSDPAVVGKTILLNGTGFTIVGVMPPDFFGARVRRSPDYWVPLSFQPQIELSKSSLEDKNTYWLSFMGRLQPGVSIGQAQAESNVHLQQFLTGFAGSAITDETRTAIQNSSIVLSPGARGISGLRRFYSHALKMLMVIVALVLLIACANVGNLLLSRAAARKPEISLRQALGATRGRLVRQLLTESLILALIGGLAGVLLAQWAVTLLVAKLAGTSPLDVNPDTSVLLFTIGISLASGVLFGIAPALRATKTDLTTALKEKSLRGRTGKFNLGSALVVVQVAVSLILLMGAGLFARSLLNLQKENLGFNRESILLASVDTRLAGYKADDLSALYRQLFDRMNALPNVQSATISSFSPLSGTRIRSTVTVRGYTPGKGEDMNVADIFVGPRFAETLQVPMLSGREIGLQDTPASAKVAVVNEAFAKAYFPNQNPLGRRITFAEDSEKDDSEIIGVIGDLKYHGAKEKVDKTVYRPILQVQDAQAFGNVFQLRTLGDPLNLTAGVKSVVAQVDAKLPVVNFTTLQLQADRVLEQDRLVTQLVSFFGVLALVLSCVGLYGIMAHAVVRRTNEIGIRIALGAQRGNILWMVMRETLVLVAIGLGLGIPASLAAAKLISTQLFGLQAGDPLTLVIAVLVLSVVGALAGFLPARKASRVDPLISLRYE